jgi:hypothetical protein
MRVLLQERIAADLERAVEPVVPKGMSERRKPAFQNSIWLFSGSQLFSAPPPPSTDSSSAPL